MQIVERHVQGSYFVDFEIMMAGYVFIFLTMTQHELCL